MEGPVEVERRTSAARSVLLRLQQEAEGWPGHHRQLTPVVGSRTARGNKIKAQALNSTDSPTLQGFVHRNTEGPLAIMAVFVVQRARRRRA